MLLGFGSVATEEPRLTIRNMTDFLEFNQGQRILLRAMRIPFRVCFYFFGDLSVMACILLTGLQAKIPFQDVQNPETTFVTLVFVK
jgi:hypothetical protein